MAKKKKCPSCKKPKWSFLVVKRPDRKVRCDSCETERLRKPVEVKLTWEDIRAHRARRLIATDWIETDGGKARAGAALTEALLTYRKKLFDVTSDFSYPDEVVWPLDPSAAKD